MQQWGKKERNEAIDHVLKEKGNLMKITSSMKPVEWQKDTKCIFGDKPTSIASKSWCLMLENKVENQGKTQCKKFWVKCQHNWYQSQV